MLWRAGQGWTQPKASLAAAPGAGAAAPHRPSALGRLHCPPGDTGLEQPMPPSDSSPDPAVHCVCCLCPLQPPCLPLAPCIPPSLQCPALPSPNHELERESRDCSQTELGCHKKCPDKHENPRAFLCLRQARQGSLHHRGSSSPGFSLLDLFEIPAGESPSPSEGTRPRWEPLVVDAVCQDWVSCRGGGGRAGGMTSEAFSHGGWKDDGKCNVQRETQRLSYRSSTHGCTRERSCGCCTPKSGGHWAPFATTVTCGEVSDCV